MPVPGDPDHGQGQDAHKRDPALAQGDDIHEQGHDQEAQGQEQEIGQVLFHKDIVPGIAKEGKTGGGLWPLFYF